MGAIKAIIVIWTVSFILTSPLYIYRGLVHYDVHPYLNDMFNISEICFCIEKWPVEYGRAYFSLFSLFFQYILPIFIVSAAYSRIYSNLRKRRARSMIVFEKNLHTKQKHDERLHKTNILLTTIAAIFAISWIPLNVYNLYVDFSMSQEALTEQLMLIYAVCHMVGMSSACSNPILYGLLNENFRNEFKEIFSCKNNSLSKLREKRISNLMQRKTSEETNDLQLQTTKTHLPESTENFIQTDLTVLTK